jgi:hypothetical protein
MPRNYSDEYKSTLAQVSGEEGSLILLTLTHPSLAGPVRIINDMQDLTSNDDIYVACPFKCILPDDFDGQLPKAALTIDNVGGELMNWIETTDGGNGSVVTFSQVMRSRPDQIEWSITMNLCNVHITMQAITAELGFENLFSKPAIKIKYRPANSPGIF